MKTLKREFWLHEGAYYGKEGTFVGCYYNNESGWYVELPGEARNEKVASRAAAIARVVASERSRGAGKEGTGT